MKKFIAILLCLCLCFACVACSNDTKPNETKSPVSTDTPTETKPPVVELINTIPIGTQITQDNIWEYFRPVEGESYGYNTYNAAMFSGKYANKTITPQTYLDFAFQDTPVAEEFLKVYTCHAEIYPIQFSGDWNKTTYYYIKLVCDDLTFQDILSVEADEINAEKLLCESVGLEWKIEVGKNSINTAAYIDAYSTHRRGDYNIYDSIADAKYFLASEEELGYAEYTLQYGKKYAPCIPLVVYRTEEMAKTQLIYLTEVIDKTTE